MLYRCAAPGPGWGAPIQGAGLGGRMIIPVLLDGRRQTALVDTGSMIGLLSVQAARLLGVTQAQTAQDPTVLLQGVGPAVARQPLHRFRSIQVGDAIAEAPSIVITDGPHTGFDMILGWDLLSRWPIWLAPSRQQMFLLAR